MIDFETAKNMTMASVADQLGVNRATFYNRVASKGLKAAVEMGASTGLKGGHNQVLKTHNGMTMNLIDWAAYLGISKDTFHARVRKYSFEIAVTMPLPPKKGNNSVKVQAEKKEPKTTVLRRALQRGLINCCRTMEPVNNYHCLSCDGNCF